MALIQCPDCGSQVSSSAAACLKCGYPIAGGGTTQAQGGKVQTVEQTSKRYKLQQLLSVLLIGVGVIVVISGVSAEQPSGGSAAVGTLLIVAGFIWYIIARFTTWWHHG